MTIPKNVLRFEILSYPSLAGALAGAALADGGPLSHLNIFIFVFVIQLIGVVAVAVCWMIYLAARERKRWPLWIVAAWQALNVLSIFAQNESPPELALDIISAALGVLGLYFACSGDAKEWFKPTQIAWDGWANRLTVAVGNPVGFYPWNGPTKASCWGSGGMANPPPLSNS
jgi:hypothetical protein